MFYYEWLTSNIYVVVQSQAEGMDSKYKSITGSTSQIFLRLEMQQTTIF